MGPVIIGGWMSANMDPMPLLAQIALLIDAGHWHGLPLAQRHEALTAMRLTLNRLVAAAESPVGSDGGPVCEDDF